MAPRRTTRADGRGTVRAVAGERTRDREWNPLTVLLPLVLAGVFLTILRLPVAAGMTVIASGLIWFRQPLAIVFGEDHVTFVVLPLWTRGIVVVPSDLIVDVTPWGVTFEDRSRPRFPVFRRLSWGRDLISYVQEPKYLKRLRAMGASFVEDI